jgi:hypothetical protein
MYANACTCTCRMHAQDLKEILDAEGFTQPIDLLVGHSMGVQVRRRSKEKGTE